MTPELKHLLNAVLHMLALRDGEGKRSAAFLIEARIRKYLGEHSHPDTYAGPPTPPLVVAFVAGAKWWEYEKSGGFTMWQSDQEAAAKEAAQRYAFKDCAPGSHSSLPPHIAATMPAYAYDAVEVHGCRQESVGPATGDVVIEMNDDNPEFFGVYLHLKTGGVECVEDFRTMIDAMAYAEELAERHGYDFTIAS